MSDPVPIDLASAIILAGGKSRRMGCDKALLPLNGKPLIAHVVDQLRPVFEQILISSSASDGDKYGFLGLPIVADTAVDQGPLRGIASALPASSHHTNFVIGCDFYEPDIDLIQRMLGESEGHDCVVPKSGEDFIEPVFAVYAKSFLPAALETLDSGQRKIRVAIEKSHYLYLPVTDCRRFETINSPQQYHALLRRRGVEVDQSPCLDPFARS